MKYVTSSRMYFEIYIFLVLEDNLKKNWTPYGRHVAISIATQSLWILGWSLPLTALCVSQGITLNLIPTEQLNEKTGKMTSIPMRAKFSHWYLANVKTLVLCLAVSATIMGILSHFQHQHFQRIENESHFLSNPPSEFEKIFK